MPIVGNNWRFFNPYWLLVYWLLVIGYRFGRSPITNNQYTNNQYLNLRRQHYLLTFNGCNLSLFFQKSTPMPQRYLNS